MIQLILHLVGDYITQSDWMAQNKTKRSWPCLCHCLLYSLPFLFIGSPSAVAVIFATHFAIDRFRLARLVVWLKNVHLSPLSFGIPSLEREGARDAWIAMDKSLQWENCKVTGYPSEQPAWLAVWLLIAADNTLHLAINYAALALL